MVDINTFCDKAAIYGANRVWLNAVFKKEEKTDAEWASVIPHNIQFDRSQFITVETKKKEKNGNKSDI